MNRLDLNDDEVWAPEWILYCEEQIKLGNQPLDFESWKEEEGVYEDW